MVAMLWETRSIVDRRREVRNIFGNGVLGAYGTGINSVALSSL
jgi:hypothetical protein